MKQNQRSGKLQLKRQVVSNLTNFELEKLEGGKEAEAAFTTSKGSCTGFTCCDPTHTCTISEITLITITFIPH